MFFFLTIAVLVPFLILWCLSSVVFTTGVGKHSEKARIAFGMLIAGFLLVVPLFQEFLINATFSAGKPVSPQGDYLPLWFIGFGGLLTVIVFGVRLRRQYANQEGKFFAIGADAFGIMLGLYLLVVVVDQVAFFVPSREDSGMLNWSVLREQGGVSDIQCRSDILLVKGVSGDVVTYRCPSESAVVMGGFSSMPIVPWPDYSEGTSRQLAAELHKVQREAIRVN